jgi:hypothetical protein
MTASSQENAMRQLTAKFGSGTYRRSLKFLAATGFLAGCATVPPAAPPLLEHSPPPPLPSYSVVLTLGPGSQWRFDPLVADLDDDGDLDLVATARLAKPSLNIWRGDSNVSFAPIKPTWTDIGYGALAMGDINNDRLPDIVAAGHLGAVQTLLNDGQGGFTETTLQRKNDGYEAAQLADLNGDGHQDLILLGFEEAGLEIYLGDGTGTWRLHRTLPESRPTGKMPGRALVLADLNHDGHLDLVAAFQRLGVLIYFGDGGGGFTGGPVSFHSASQEFRSVALGDVNNDDHLDIVINGTLSGNGQPNGPDVYLGDGSGGWKASSTGLKVLKIASAGIALGDLDSDGNLDIVAAGNVTGEPRAGYGLFWFKGDGSGAWRLVLESGLPSGGMAAPSSVTLADLDRDRVPEIISLNGGAAGRGSITIWQRKDSRTSTKGLTASAQ